MNTNDTNKEIERLIGGMSKREPSVLLDDIRTSIEKIQRYTAGLDGGSFLADEKTTDAVVRNLEIIGTRGGTLE